MNNKTVNYSITLTLIFTFALGINQYMLTQEEKKKSKISPALATYTGASMACAALGSLLPCSSPAAALLMRRYFLTGMTAQTLAGTAVSLSETLKDEKPSWKKAAADIGYGLYNMAFVELARRLPYDTPARALFLKRYATFCLTSQALGVIGKDYAAPAFCSIRKGFSDYTTTIDPKDLETTAHSISWPE